MDGKWLDNVVRIRFNKSFTMGMAFPAQVNAMFTQEQPFGYMVYLNHIKDADIHEDKRKSKKKKDLSHPQPCETNEKHEAIVNE